ncbi:HNH endonuclease [uncultured virus]|nr:HNH endonuclease [uncultured virus]
MAHTSIRKGSRLAIIPDPASLDEQKASALVSVDADSPSIPAGTTSKVSTPKKSSRLNIVSFEEKVKPGDSTQLSATTPSEEWRALDEYPGYLISSLGRLMTKRKRISETKPGLNGYIVTSLIGKNGKYKAKNIHTLVAAAFLDNSFFRVQVNHINGNRSDNRVVNLEWATNPVSKHDKPKNDKLELPVEHDALVQATATVQDTASSQEELWKELEQYPGYQVSSLGRFVTRRGFISKAKPNSYTGYLHVGVCDAEGRSYTKGIHTLVAMAFIPNPENKPCVDHINGVTADNRVSNLRWATAKENSNNKVFKNDTCAGRQVVQYKLDGSLVQVWESIASIKDTLNLTRDGIFRCCNETKDNYAGFIWKYYENVAVFPGEKWVWSTYNDKPIPVSSYGRIRTPMGRLTFGGKGAGGYMMGTRGMNIHRLVCLGFYPRSDHKELQVDHIDGNRSNNRIENLRWVTPAQNMQHAWDRRRGLT